MKLKIVVEPDEAGFHVARCPSLKGCWSQGKTKAEAVENIKEAILLYLDAGAKSFKPTSKQKVLGHLTEHLGQVGQGDMPPV